MLQTNLIFGIQKQIKAGSKHAHKMGIIEESTQVEEVSAQRAEPILESSFVAGIYTKAANAKKKEVIKNSLITESFHLSKARKKLEKDVAYFNYLYESFVDDVFKDQYRVLLESIFEDTIKLYEECDVTPRLVSQTLDSNELNENQIVDIYKNRLNETIKNNFTKPLLSGKITEIYENEIRTITKKLITEGSNIDMEQVKVYLPFEETIYQFNRSILIPEIAETRIESFMESMTDEYLEFIEESAEEMLRHLEKKIKLLTSLISPNMFGEAVDSEDIEAPKMAGISITVDKNFDDLDSCDEPEGCPDEAVISDPEASEEISDEMEADAIEDENSDIVSKEEEVRGDMELANDAEDYENIPEMDEEAEESAAEETEETGEQPGAVELELSLDNGTENDNGLVTNDNDIDLQGDGQDTGVDPNGSDATLPGGADNVGIDIDSDDGVESSKELESKEDVSSESPEEEAEEEELEDVSEEDKSSKDKETISEGTTQDKKPQAQNAPNGSGSMPGGGTTQDKGIAGASKKAAKLNSGKTGQDKKPGSQGGAPNGSGSMPGGGTTQNKNLSKAKNTGNNAGSMPGGNTTQDKKPGSQGGAPNGSGSMPGGKTGQDKHLS
jgi:hypothetical protein